MEGASPAHLEGVRALSDAIHRDPLAKTTCVDTEICDWAVDLGGYEHIEVPDMLIGVLTGGDVRWATRNTARAGCFRRGRVAIIPARTWLRMRPVSPLTATTVHISPERTNRAFNIDNGSQLLEQANLRIGMNDPLVASCLTALANELKNPTEHGSIMVDSVIISLLHQVLFSANRTANMRAPGGLSAATLRKLEEYIEAQLSDPIRLADLARLVSLSEFYFCKAFKAATGMTAHQFVTSARLRQARTMLANPAMDITDIALAVGFSSHSHLCTVFRREVGTSPSLYRKSLIQ